MFGHINDKLMEVHSSFCSQSDFFDNTWYYRHFTDDT